MLLEVAITIDDQTDSQNKLLDTKNMDTEHSSFFSLVCDQIMKTINDDQFKITTINFINALTINLRSSLNSSAVMFTPFQILVDKERIQVSYLHEL